ncbi:uncharacterized protein LOC120674744 [Panicum virgatum]|uniref:uncharacterized protein LOC120674744 n=1 Tax=Panicum virgatum TaxID=38727 RepID=UPI0019D55109|nr:uncharacterized protein LOC120674744 [Panicum virgatum]
MPGTLAGRWPPCTATCSLLTCSQLSEVQTLNLEIDRTFSMSDCNKGQGGNDAFVIDGWDGYNKSDRLRDHVGSKCNSFHNTAVKRCDNLLKPGLAFHGHDETEESTNKGNFRELVQLLAMENGKIIVKSIIEEIGGDVFCLLVDESADVSGKEQMVVVLRYVDKLGVIKERLIAVVRVQETSASCMISNIDNLFAKYGLSIKQIRGQGYDGASNMRASCKCKDMIREKQQERVRKAIGSGQLHSGTGLNQEQSHQTAGDTHWGSHYKILKSLSNLFSEIIEVLQYVEKEVPNDAKRRQARGLLDYLKDFDFVFHLHLIMLILGHANCLSLSLQRKDKHILEAMLEVKLTKQKFQQIRDNGWDSLLQDVQSFCEKHGIPKLDMDEEYIDRHRPRKKTNRTNYQHYKYDCFNPIIDLQLAEFNDRFNEANSQLLTQIATFHPKNSFEAFKFESLMELAKSYPDDFDSTQLRDLGRELNIYIDNVKADERFANLNTISELAKLMVGTNKHLGFPLVYRLLKLVLVLPVATASVERCFSAIKIVKTILRNRIGDGFLNDCIVCFVEQEFLATIPIDDVITRFHKMDDRNRRGNR